MQHKTIKGVSVPALGFGTWQLDRKTAERMTAAALEMGYRHIDTAQMYQNEDGVGAGIKKTGIPREDFFLTTKVHPKNYAKERFLPSVEKSLEQLSVDQVDLLLLHWPNPQEPFEAIMESLQQAQQRGFARHIGISNHPVALMQAAEKQLGKGALLTNQVEYHALLDQQKVLTEVRRQQMLLTAYCPLAQGKLIDNPVLQRIGKAHGKHALQVALRWLIQQDSVIAIPRTSNVAHARSNLAVFDFELSDEDMAAIAALQGNNRIVDPGFAPEWDAPS